MKQKTITAEEQLIVKTNNFAIFIGASSTNFN